MKAGIFKFFLILSFLFFAVPEYSFSELTVPGEPETPVVVFDSGSPGTERKASITAESAKALTGTVCFSSDKVIVPVLNQYPKHKTVSVSNIKYIRFLKWKARKINDCCYCFYPSRVRIGLNNNSEFNCGNIKIFNCITTKNKKIIYSCFYDYNKEGKWENLGIDSSKMTVERPLRGTVRKIEFKSDLPDNMINQFLKNISGK